ncbi:MAG: hypothetical protein JNK07_14035 [Alphaproteobacteria bacterium]|nr:hypothetical protein [Alphaproteobacteria bacterium]
MNKQLAAMGLRFADPVQEQNFRAAYAAEVLVRQRVLAGFGLVVFLVFALRDIAIGPVFGWEPFYWRIFVILPLLAFAFVSSFTESLQPQFPRIFAALLIAVIAATGTLSLLYPPYGPNDPAQMTRTLSTMMMLVATMCVAGLRFEHAVVVGGIAAAFWMLGSIARPLPPPLYPSMILNIVTTFLICAAVAYWLERAARDAFAARLAAKAEIEKRQDALVATLPKHVAERLVRNERPIAEAFVEAFVVLADLAGFSTLLKRIGPKRAVQMLDDLFTEFDVLTEKHRLQRLRTVGDSYVAVGGTFDSQGGAAEAAQMALDMLEAVARVATRYDLPLRVRIGVHVGPLIGGVVGRTAPIYDFWGDAFDVAAGLQSAADAGQILCSENFYWRAGRTWAFEGSGAREFAGVGTLQTFRLIGPARAAQAAD